jgi:hypothetical protein
MSNERLHGWWTRTNAETAMLDLADDERWRYELVEMGLNPYLQDEDTRQFAELA